MTMPPERLGWICPKCRWGYSPDSAYCASCAIQANADRAESSKFGTSPAVEGSTKLNDLHDRATQMLEMGNWWVPLKNVPDALTVIRDLDAALTEAETRLREVGNWSVERRCQKCDTERICACEASENLKVALGGPPSSPSRTQGDQG